MTRDPARPAEHPLVELAFDLCDALARTFADGSAHTRLGLQRHESLRGVLSSARRFVDALELVLDELEEQTRVHSCRMPNREGLSDDDFETITVSTT
jgi:hypothetical protein